MSKHIGTHQITFAKCDGSANTDSDCLSTPYSKHYSVAVYAVLDDLKKTNNLQSPYIFELTLGPKGCDTNSIERMIPRMPFANIYSLKSKEIERFGYQPVHTQEGCPAKVSLKLVTEPKKAINELIRSVNTINFAGLEIQTSDSTFIGSYARYEIVYEIFAIDHTTIVDSQSR